MFGWKSKIDRLILDNMTNGVYLVDENYKIRYWNNAAEILSGYAANDMIGNIFDRESIPYEDDNGNVLQFFEYPLTKCFTGKKT